MTADDIIEGYEATPQQRRAWPVVGPAVVEVEVSGRLDADRFAAALAAVHDRHEIIRTRLQRVRGLAVPLAVPDAGTWSAEIVEVGEDDRLVRLSCPAYALDAWSATGICAELAAGYAGEEIPEPLQYPDFAAWQAEILADPAGVTGREHWRLAPAPGPALPLRTATGAPSEPRVVAVPVIDPAPLERLADRTDGTVTSALLACWSALLERLTGQDVTVAVGFDGRCYPELAGTVGPYGRHLPVRLAAGSVRSLTELAAMAADRLRADGEWQEYYQPADERAAVPVALDVLDAAGIHRSGDVQIELAAAHTQLEPVELRLVGTRTRRGLALALEFDAAVYREPDVVELAGQLHALLADLAAGTDRPTGAVRMLPADQVPVDDTTVTRVADCLHELAAATAARLPEQVAVRSGATSLTYAELDRRANRMANALLARGVRRGDLVPVALHRGPDLVVAELGILKAGAAYVPLDPDQPADRLAAILAEVTAPVLVTAGPAPAGTAVLDPAGPEPAAAADTAPEVAVGERDLAYVYFTSGSTGGPKGVVIDHRGAVNTLLDVNAHFGVGPDDLVLALSAPTFDLAAYDVFGALAAGATVVLVEEADSRDPRAWAALVRRERITVWDSVPAVFSAVVTHAERRAPESLSTLRVAMLSGDWIPVTLPDRARALVPALRVESMGGATEASIWSVRYPIGAVDPAWTSIPYGGPMENQRIHVVTDGLLPCPVWGPGELVIGGVGVALGYLGRPGLTADRFVPDPWGGPGGRLYRTGDLGRRRPDGTIEFLGRVDDQVKVRGFRVELGEVTTNLLTHPAVRDAVTVVRDDHGTGPRLVAYAVGEDLEPVALRDHLAMRLPAYLVPATVVALAELPLTGNGKVNRAALPEPAAAVVEHVEPRDDLERELAAMWTELLDVPGPGVRHDFFDLGGHSLLLAELAGRITESYDVEIPLQVLFEQPTIEEIAVLVLGAQLAGVGDEEAHTLLAEARGAKSSRDVQ